MIGLPSHEKYSQVKCQTNNVLRNLKEQQPRKRNTTLGLWKLGPPHKHKTKRETLVNETFYKNRYHGKVCGH